MRYSVYGKFNVEVVRRDNDWSVFRIGQGVKRLDPDIYIDPDATKAEILVALDDAFHEFATSDTTVEEISE